MGPILTLVDMLLNNIFGTWLQGILYSLHEQQLEFLPAQ